MLLLECTFTCTCLEIRQGVLEFIYMFYVRALDADTEYLPSSSLNSNSLAFPTISSSSLILPNFPRPLSSA